MVLIRPETEHWQQPSPYCKIRRLSGSNSVVECDLAKVEVAGSNPVSRSRFLGSEWPPQWSSSIAEFLFV